MKHQPLIFATLMALAAGSAFAAPPAATPAAAPAPAPAAAPAAPAPAASAPVDGATLYQTKTCWACHGKDGKTTVLPNYPKIAGQNIQYIEEQMHDIKHGVRTNRSAAAMAGIMVLVSDDEIKPLAEYVSQMKP